MCGSHQLIAIQAEALNRNMKRIIICFDGTFDDTGDTPERTKPGSTVSRLSRWILPPLLWQILWVLRIFAVFKWIEHGLLGLGPNTGETLVTNASLLASAIKPLGHIAKDEGAQLGVHQMVLYIGGIGALGNPQSRVEEAVTGNTMTYKVRYAYRLIVDNYHSGDEIFVFGFSRGAFAARALAELINYQGILKKSAIADFDNAWSDFIRPDRAHKSSVKDRSELQEEEEVTDPDDRVHEKRSIRCIGVWDTVGSLGPPPLFFIHRDDASTAHAAHRRHGHFDIGQKPKTDYAFHALALDERRFDFYPALWALPTQEPYPERYCQTWFSGVHTDVGGGKVGGLSQYALMWMVSKIQEDGLLDLDEDFVQTAIIKPMEDAPPPWDIAIRGRDYIERLVPRLGRYLPRVVKDAFRTAHRHPYIPATVTRETPVGAASSTHSKLHWSVVERTRRSRGAYWASCPTLRKRDPAASEGPREEDIQEHMERPVGKDLELMQHFCNL
jgi:hypothetical protein